MSESQRAFEVLRRFAATTADDRELTDAMLEFCEHATTILEATGAGVSIATTGGDLEFLAATHEGVAAVERAQEAGQVGPCVEAYRSGEVVAVGDISQLNRWGDYGVTAANQGFTAVVGIPLTVGEHRVGSLDVYDHRLRGWGADSLAAAGVLSDMATAYVVRSSELAAARELSRQLQSALDSRVVIEQAKGMLARAHSLSVEDAFAVLRSHARTNHVSLRSVAQAVVEDGLELPSE